MSHFKLSVASMEGLMEIYENQFPELKNGDLDNLFESLPATKNHLINNINRGDILIRRQYGHHNQVWFGIVEFVKGTEAQVYSKMGRRRIQLPENYHWLNQELKVLKPSSRYSPQTNYQHFSEALYAEDETTLPTAIVLSKQADVFTEADAGTKTDTLAKDTSIIKILEKKEIKKNWWYKIEYKLNGKNAGGWTLAINILEIANPNTFTFLSPGGSGYGSSFKKLKEAVDDNNLLPSVARSINFINYLILPEDPTLPDLIRKGFFHALVSAKGDFKKAALIIAAAARAAKDADGKYPWVQSKIQTKTKFDYLYYRDKIWHFFWNAYEIFSGTGPTYLDFKGVMYELKTRDKPIRSLLTLDPLEKDAKEDIIFNRGGSMYAQWVNKNSDAVYKFHTQTTIDSLFDAVDKDTEAQKLPFEKKKELVMKIFSANEDALSTEIKKNSYADFADYAGKAFENVLEAVAKMTRGSSSEELAKDDDFQMHEFYPSPETTNVDADAQESEYEKEYPTFYEAELLETNNSSGGWGETEVNQNHDDRAEQIQNSDASGYQLPEEEAYEEQTDEVHFDVPAEKGITDYLNISSVKNLNLTTGVFIPAGYDKSDKVDLVIYFHGLYDRGDETNGIEYYWKNYSNIRESFFLSQRNAILIAPTLTSNPQAPYISLKRKFGLDDFVSACFKELKFKKYLLLNAEPSQIILAGHSAGGSLLRAILAVENKLLNKVLECWGFDCLYNYGWEELKSRIPFYHYWAHNRYGKISGPGSRGEALKKSHPNIKNIPPGKTVYHQGIIQYAWLNYINNRSWFNPIISASKPAASKRFTERAYPESDDGFSTVSIPLHTRPITIVKENRQKKLVEIREAPSVFLKEIIRMALGSDAAEHWFNNFTSITFLGRELRQGEYVHIELAKHLKGVEKEFAKKFGGANADPKIAGDYLLGTTNERIAGSRAVSATGTYSYHMFGLAIDVNYSGSPFIQNKQRKGRNEKTKDEFIIPNGKITMNETLANAASLFDVAKVKFEYNLSYDEYASINKFLISYLTLGDDKNEQKLSSLLSKTSSPDWRGNDVTEAKKKIQGDLDKLALSIDRWSKKDVFKEKGFLNFSKEFVDGVKLNWGAWYGDMMHFDMRTVGVGSKIEAAKNKYISEKNAESRAKYKQIYEKQSGSPTEEWEEADDQPKKLNEYNPSRSDTIVINTMEFETGIKGIKNYRNWSTDRSVIHNRHKNKYRDPFGIKHLVLHETAADTGDGFDDSKNETSHLSVKKDATILQFNDLVEWENHGTGMNKTGIGIEFVNRGWLSSTAAKGGEDIPAKEESLTDDQKEKYKESNGYLWVFWGSGFNIYRLPTSLDQLEKEVELVKWITEDLQITIQEIKGISIYNLFPWIDQEWLQLVNYNEVKEIWTFRAEKIPAESERSKKNLFVMTTGYEYLTPDKIEKKTGIISHNAFYENHSDGSFLSLYTWLRLKKGKDKTQAYNICKKLMKDYFITVSLKSDSAKKIILLDVSDANLI